VRWYPSGGMGAIVDSPIMRAISFRDGIFGILACKTVTLLCQVLLVACSGFCHRRPELSLYQRKSDCHL
jgi:hypothetical protein